MDSARREVLLLNRYAAWSRKTDPDETPLDIVDTLRAEVELLMANPMTGVLYATVFLEAMHLLDVVRQASAARDIELLDEADAWMKHLEEDDDATP